MEKTKAEEPTQSLDWHCAGSSFYNFLSVFPFVSLTLQYKMQPLALPQMLFPAGSGVDAGRIDVAIGLASVPITLLNDSTGRSAAVPVWWAASRTATPPSCWSVPGCAMWPAPSGAARSTWTWSTWRQPLKMPPLLADFTHARPCKPFCEKYLTLPAQWILFVTAP